MANSITMGANFPKVLAREIFSKVQGHSSIAKLNGGMPLSFAGNDVMVFSMDSDVNIVAENGAKGEGGAKAEPVSIVPIKIEYGTRVSDEFMNASEERQLEILQAFIDGFTKKAARGLDVMAFHGLNPKTKTESSIIGTNAFDKNTGVATVTAISGDADGTIEALASAIGDYNLTGLALSKTYASELAKMTVNGVKMYPELGWGANPDSVNGVPVDVNTTVSVAKSGVTGDLAIGGDFQNAFKWGFADEIPLEVIPYGDPDNTGKDLKGHNQVYLRGEAYIGWGILDPSAFAVVRPSA